MLATTSPAVQYQAGAKPDILKLALLLSPGGICNIYESLKILAIIY
jgi:hypothetical protein